MSENSKLSQAVAPYLSVVTASRNDDHGGDPLIRTQIFINNFARQCEKYRLPAELILVDWNPVADRPGLAAVLQLPQESNYCKARVITVPAFIHQRFKYADKLSFFQMIAKNVGIRRALGQFILATNIDIIFSDELMRFIAQQRLDPKKQYRVDRYDIHGGLTEESSLDEVINYAWANPVRANRRYHPEKLVSHLYGDDVFRRICKPDAAFCERSEGVEVVDDDGFWQVRSDRSVRMSCLHTNACGDFTLLSREGWKAIRGYPEFEAFSFNIDSMGMLAAHYGGYEEVSLLPPCVCFHIEHGIGSGWTPEGEKKLFNRLRDAGILNPEWPVLTPLVDEMREQGKRLEFNHVRWGMADFDLPEQAMGDTNVIPADKLEHLALRAETREVSAIQPAYDLDRLTLAYERRLAENAATVAENVGMVVAQAIERDARMYIPDEQGNYSEINSISHQGFNVQTPLYVFVFCLDKFAHQFPLRFDPCQSAGLITISSITVFDVAKNSLITLNAAMLKFGGTAVLTQPKPLKKTINLTPLSVLSTGADPQLFLPPLSGRVGFPLVVSVEMKFIPSE